MFKIPAFKSNFKNDPRKVGYEIEYSGIEIPEVVEIIRDLFDGKVEEKNRYYYNIFSEIGKFTVKIDSSFLYQEKYREILDKIGIKEEVKEEEEHRFYKKIEKLLEDIASGFIPNEIVTPPVNIDKLDTFDPLVEKMKKKKAEGTGQSIIYAFATHINPETPSLETGMILRYLRAFLLLYEWLYKELKIDFTRKLTTFISPFEKEYAYKVINPDYKPGIDQFIADYIEFNPKRDRPLDLYPLLSYIKPETKEKEKSGIVKTRPTFHYRLPNSEIDIEEWCLSYEWNYWWYVEELASDNEAIQNLSRQYLELRKESLVDFRSKWIEIIHNWTKDKG